MGSVQTEEVRLEEALLKEKALIDNLRNLGKVAVAYSGGVDSTYLTAVARETLRNNALAFFVKGAMIAPAEEREAQELAQTLGFELKVLTIDVFQIPGFSENSSERCYYCKHALFSLLKQEADRRALQLTEGSNHSDMGDFRPGLKALRELGIISPLLQAGLTKAEIRFLARRRGLPNWNKPAQACLASRIPFGQKISPEILEQVAQAEQVLTNLGFSERRVRVHGNLARIEVPRFLFSKFLEHKEEIVKELLKLGFRFITLDLEGLRSGSLNP